MKDWVFKMGFVRVWLWVLANIFLARRDDIQTLVTVAVVAILFTIEVYNINRSASSYEILRFFFTSTFLVLNRALAAILLFFSPRLSAAVSRITIAFCVYEGERAARIQEKRRR